MIALRLFSLTDASRQIDVRVLGEREEITLGRDEAADWPLPDPDRALSRLHLKVGVRDGAVSVTDTSTNGVTSTAREERLPRDRPVRVEPGERLELGPYVLLIERSDHVVAPAPTGRRDGANPFAPTGEIDEPAETHRRVDPFASGMAPDPLAEEPFADGSFAGSSSAGGGLRLGSAPVGGAPPRGGLPDGDVWDRRGEQRAGDWNAAPSRSEPMIGTPQVWNEPPAKDGDERGFGFDAPSDWDGRPADPPLPNAAPASPFDAPAEEGRRQESGAEPSARYEPSPSEPFPSEPVRPKPAPPELASPGPPVAPGPGVRPQAQPMPAATPVQPAASGAKTAGLFEAFCTGAKLDPAALAGEDPAVLMERLGVVYRHMVLGLSDVLGERTALKNEYRMVRTVIQADENNPFKWAPPQKVATELLRSADDGFLDGPAAVAESYQDVKKHLLCMLAGLRAALASSLDALAPARIEEAIKDQSFVLKPRAAVAWGEYVKVYNQFRKEAEDSADSPVNREFRAAYEKQLDELDRMALR